MFIMMPLGSQDETWEQRRKLQNSSSLKMEGIEL